MKKIYAVLLASVMALSMTACGGKEETTTAAPQTTAAAEETKAAVEETEKEQADYGWKSEKQVELVVPFGAGGSSDLSARALVPYLEKELGCTIFVNNVSGAGGLTGTSYALNKAADGYTLMWEGTRSTSPEVYSLEAPYTTADLIPIERKSGHEICSYRSWL